MSNKSGVADQILVSLPRGGGDVRGLGETFSPDLHTGTGNFTIPIALPQGRRGLAPSLTLSYSSGQGNGPFGLGVSLSVPGVARKTTRGVPRYDDRDVFLVSGAEDLVPISRGDGVTEYRPRTEGTFSRLLRHVGPQDDYWEVRARDGRVDVFGTPGARGADPAAIAAPGDALRVFAWKLASTVDPFGNRIEYAYTRDGSQVYLSEIRYGDFGSPVDFLVRVKLTYAPRPDPFSDRRAGFEIRTALRCARIDVVTAAPLRTYHLEYLDEVAGLAGGLPENGVSLLARVRVEGHDGDASEQLPPLDLGYGRFALGRRRLLRVTGPDLPPLSLAHPELELADLFGTGLPDLVQIGPTGARYWRNLGDGRFERAREVEDAPAGVSLGDPGVQLADADGDGRIDLLVTTPPLAGYYPLRLEAGGSARSFRRFENPPSFDLKDPEVRLVDLDGDGVTDAIRSGTRMECYFNDPELGWVAPEAFERGALEAFPNVSFSDRRVQLADMTGDGLQDVVLVHDGHVDYWPSLGRGRWGARVSMRGAPRLPEGYDPRRVLIGDVDGDGAADLVYVDDGAITLWINQGGNAFGPPLRIAGTPRVSDLDAVRLVDLLGTGTRGILWADASGLGGAPMFFLDLTGGHKPYLLETIDGHRGSTTRVSYAPSTRFYLADLARPETRWKTSLPFPVQVVARSEVTDAFTGGRLTTDYSFHHGYWDGVERELRGFGRVDRRDAERIPLEGTPTEFSPPTETRTWFHPGPVGDARGFVEIDFGGELWPGDAPALPRAPLPEGLPAPARRDALRALRGTVLRTEVYALDGGPLAALPHTVTEEVHGVREESAPPVGSPRRRVFFAHALATRTTQWERGSDPMTELRFVGDYDTYGQAGYETRIAVPRGRDFRIPGKAGEPYLATHTRTDRARPGDSAPYIVDRVARATTYDVANDGSASAGDLARSLEAGPGTHPIIAQVLHYYDGEAFTGGSFGALGRYGALVRSETLVLTRSIAEAVYPTVPPYLVQGDPAWTEEYPQEFRELLASNAGYVWRSGPEQAPGWFAVSEQRKYDFHDDPACVGRGLVTAERDPLGRETTIAYDEPYRVLPAVVIDPADLVTSVTYDHRVLSPSSATDPNGNRTSYGYTPLGLVDRIAVMGKEGEARAAGDTLDQPTTRFVYDFSAFADRGAPISLRTIKRVWHATDASAPPAERDQPLASVDYFDGMGRKLQTHTQAADDSFGDPRSGRLDLDAPSVGRPAGAAPRVLVSGAQAYDNKGRVVEKYEPAFDEGFAYAPLQQGDKDVMYYDPRGRLVRTVHPDGSEERVVQGIPADLADPDAFAPTPWEAYTYDRNDDAGRTHPAASAAYRSHWNTPSSVEVDALGRVRRSVERNGADQASWHTTITEHDVRGNPLRVVDPLGRVAFAYAYSLTDQPLRTTTLDGGTTVTVMDAAGSPVERRDAKGALTLHGYDMAGCEIRVWARDAAGEPATLRERTTYGGAADSGLTPQAARARNLLGRPYQRYDEAGLATVVAYDFKGRALDATRQVVADGRLLGIFADPPPGWAVRPFRVDWQPPPGTTLADHEKGLLDAAVYLTTTTYDALDHVRTLRCPADVTGARRELRSRYDRAGALEGVDLDGDAYVERIVYDAKGQTTLVARGNGVMTRRDYDPKTWRLVRLQTVRFASPAALSYAPSGAPLQEMRYAYDLAGNLISLQDRAPGSGVPQQPDQLDRAFAYDPLYRLVAASGREAASPCDDPWSPAPRPSNPTKTRLYGERYEYDPAGNLTRLTHESKDGTFVRGYALAAGGNRLSALTVGQTSSGYAYDACGNLTGEAQSRRFAWDHADRMRTFVTQGGTGEPSVHAQYLYDGAGQRVAKIVRKQGGQYEVTHHVGGAFEHRRAVQGATRVENDTIHVAAGGARAAIVRVGPALAGDTAPDVTHHVGDHLGSSNVVLDGQGGFVSREEYTPYGETSFGGFARKRYRFSGKERDEESGLAYHGARYYAPWLGRWASRDPAGVAEGCNPYRYVRNGPLNLVDPGGAESEPVDKASIEGAGVGVVQGAPAGPTLQVPNSYDPVKMQAYGSGVVEGRIGNVRGTGVLRSDPAHRAGEQAFKDSVPQPSEPAPSGRHAADHVIELQHDLSGKSGTSAKDFRWQDSRLNSTEGARSRPLKASVPATSGGDVLAGRESLFKAGAVARAAEAGRWQSREGLRTVARGAGVAMVLYGAYESGDRVASSVVDDLTTEGANWQFTARAVGTEAAGWAGAMAAGLKGAAIGAGFGAPIPVVGSAIGGVVGGLIGGALGFIGAKVLAEGAITVGIWAGGAQQYVPPPLR